nr:hypothetical protein KPHV_00080 [Kitasatospora purpeofusca]BEK71250.1 hypothetical protein KPHV_84770 [Kitasatospora purpeofusca]
MTKRNTDQQRARELQHAEGIGYHEALNRVRETRQHEPEINSSVVLTDSTLIAVEAANGVRCMACHKGMDFDEWGLHLADVSSHGYFQPVLCASCAKAIGNAAARIPALPAPDPEDPDTILVPAQAGRDQVVAHLSQDRVHLLCRRHTPEAPTSHDDRYQPVTAEELEALGHGFRPGGGGHNCSVCNLDVLTV